MSQHLKLVKGSRVRTKKYGRGTVVNFEVLGMSKCHIFDTPGDGWSRVGIALDNPELWACHAPGVLPYFWKEDLL